MAKAESNELRLIREYDAPLSAVWEAWTDDAQVKQWWGPRGFSITTHRKDLRPGGTWDYTMHGPDGTDYPNKTKYLVVERGAKLVYDHGGNDERAPMFRVTVLFSESAGRTTIDLTMALPTAEAATAARKFVKQASGESTWDRLAEHLESERSGVQKFVINRTFAAPIDLVFRMWTEPEHVARWLAPTGFEMKYLTADIRPGGRSSYVMTGPGETKMYGRAEYLKLERPRLLVYTQQFCDEHGNVSRHPAAPTWPETMLTTVRFAEEDDGATRVTVTWEIHGPVTAAELATFIAGRAGMTGGWTGSFDKLEGCLSSTRGG